MLFSKLSVSALVATVSMLSSSVHAHMIMKSPVPYGKSTLNNSPLAADGSDFPCKQRTGVYDAEGASNIIPIGVPQTLSFTGSAVHGGGSCQVSLTSDLQPTKNSKWMVIKSIEGGCPASTAGNLPADPNGSGASTFQYTVPAGITPGDYTIAWSWINKIGNREFYMNCGPATITAPKKRRYAPAPKVSKRQTSFPDMFVANLASVNDCKTPETFDYNYPNPGADVQSAGTGPYTTLSCGAAAAAAPAQTPTGSAAAAGAATSAGAAAPAATSSAASGGLALGGGASSAAASAPSVVPISPGVFASSAGAAAPSVAPQATSTETVSPIPAAANTASAAAPAATGSTSTGSTSTVAGTPCSNEGAYNCAGSSFQRCASGVWSVSIPLAAGTTCQTFGM